MFSNKSNLRKINAALGLLILGMLAMVPAVQAEEFSVFIHDDADIGFTGLTVEFNFRVLGVWQGWSMNEGGANGT